MRNSRLLGCLGLSLGVAVLAILFGWILLRFSTPHPDLLAAGSVTEYLPGEAPRLFFDEDMPVYVLNINGEILALMGRSEVHRVRCLVHWQAAEEAFVDPCLGTHFSPEGAYLGKGPPGELLRLPLEVRDGQVWVNLGYR